MIIYLAGGGIAGGGNRKPQSGMEENGKDGDYP